MRKNNFFLLNVPSRVSATIKMIFNCLLLLTVRFFARGYIFPNISIPSQAPHLVDLHPIEMWPDPLAVLPAEEEALEDILASERFTTRMCVLLCTSSTTYSTCRQAYQLPLVQEVVHNRLQPQKPCCQSAPQERNVTVHPICMRQ